MKDTQTTVAVIGGSGLEEGLPIDVLTTHEVKTPYGSPSGEITEGMTANGVRVLFLPRHGEGHVLSPGKVPYRANILALKKLGAEYAIGVSAVGSLKRDVKIGDFVLPDQAIGFFCHDRKSTFFDSEEDRMVAHVNVGEPFCAELRDMLASSVEAVGVRCHGGKYVCISGNAYSTIAESEFFGALRCTTVGMTNFPEYPLAREACLPYVALQLVTDYDNLPGEAHLCSDLVVAQMMKNAELAKRAIAHFLSRPDLKPPTCDCVHALDHAIATPQERWSDIGRRKLEILMRR
ncbi:MAG: MTAP family purine nucleoside phosphorylase [Candidatus Magasanikbacteria bacterium]